MASRISAPKRTSYAGKIIPNHADPFRLFSLWYKEAARASRSECNAMTLATASAAGKPSARQVLLKSFDTGGFIFFTHRTSRKGSELIKNPFAALLFYWPELHRQVRIEGEVREIPLKDADEYFATRPRESQIGAWASKQSHSLTSRKTLLERYALYEKKFKGIPVPRPPSWTGFSVTPRVMEFWSGMPNRLHDRVIFKKKNGRWISEKLFP